MTSTLTRTIDYLAGQGYRAAVVERRLTGFCSVDLFGFADVIAFHPDQSVERGVLLVQVKGGSASSSMIAAQCTILGIPAAGATGRDIARAALCRKIALEWLLAGNFITIHQWRRCKVKTKAGSKKPYRVVVSLDELAVSIEDFMSSVDRLPAPTNGEAK